MILTSYVYCFVMDAAVNSLHVRMTDRWTTDKIDDASIDRDDNSRSRGMNQEVQLVVRHLTFIVGLTIAETDSCVSSEIVKHISTIQWDDQQIILWEQP